MAKPTKELMKEHNLEVLNKLDNVDAKTFKKRAMEILTHQEIYHFDLSDQLEILSQVKLKAELALKNKPDDKNDIFKQLEIRANSFRHLFKTKEYNFAVLMQVLDRMLQTNDRKDSESYDDFKARGVRRVHRLIRNLSTIADPDTTDIRYGVFREYTTPAHGTVRNQLDREVKHLERQARALERKAKALEQQGKALQQQGRKLREEGRQLRRQGSELSTSSLSSTSKSRHHSTRHAKNKIQDMKIPDKKPASTIKNQNR